MKNSQLGSSSDEGTAQQSADYLCKQCGGTKPTCCSCPTESLDALSQQVRGMMKSGDTEGLAAILNRGNREKARQAIARIQKSDVGTASPSTSAPSAAPNVEQLKHALAETVKQLIRVAMAEGETDPREPASEAWLRAEEAHNAAIEALCAAITEAGRQQDAIILPATCEHCDGPLTCDPQMREALAGEKHLVAQLLDRAEQAEARLADRPPSIDQGKKE